jgi:hypothetical protein
VTLGSAFATRAKAIKAVATHAREICVPNILREIKVARGLEEKEKKNHESNKEAKGMERV